MSGSMHSNLEQIKGRLIKVIEHPSNMFISDAFFLDSCDRDMKDSADAAVEEDFELVGKGFAHGPGFASP